MDILETLSNRILVLIPVLLSLSVHEWAHAWTALQLGDDTAERQQRVSFNPLVHIDPVGTLLLPLLGVPFGWAKPVPFQAIRFRQGVSMRWGAMLVALAGPVSNFILVAVCVLISKALSVFGLLGEAPHELLGMLITINLSLGLFNLIPVPPLDGSWILDAVLPDRLHQVWSRIMSSPVASIAALLLVVMFAGEYLSIVVRALDRAVGGF